MCLLFFFFFVVKRTLCISSCGFGPHDFHWWKSMDLRFVECNKRKLGLGHNVVQPQEIWHTRHLQTPPNRSDATCEAYRYIDTLLSRGSRTVRRCRVHAHAHCAFTSRRASRPCSYLIQTVSPKSYRVHQMAILSNWVKSLLMKLKLFF